MSLPTYEALDAPRFLPSSSDLFPLLLSFLVHFNSSDLRYFASGLSFVLSHKSVALHHHWYLVGKGTGFACHHW